MMLPAHSTHAIQPLDCLLFRNLKQQLQRNPPTYQENDEAAVRRCSLITALDAAICKSFNKVDIRKSFQLTGLEPLDKSIIFKRL